MRSHYTLPLLTVTLSLFSLASIPSVTSAQNRSQTAQPYPAVSKSVAWITNLPYVTGGGPEQQLDLYIPTDHGYCEFLGREVLLRDWILPRVLELTYNTWDLRGFAEDCGYNGIPFRRDEVCRFLLRCELDALFFHKYLGSAQEWADQPAALRESFHSPRAAVSYIIDTFPIVKKRDEQEHDGENRTKDTILEIYDEMAEAARTGIQYQTRLNPPPADPSVAHSPVSLPVLGES
jgi:hypothetical protein